MAGAGDPGPGGWSSVGCEMGPLLRFLDPGLEDRFLLARRKGLLRGSTFLVSGGLFVITVKLADVFVPFDGRDEVDLHDAHVRMSLSIKASLLTFLLMYWLAVRSLSMFQLEVVSAATMIILMNALVLGAPHTLASLMQVAQDADTYASDSGCLLIIQGVFMGAYLGLPMRWCVMLPLALNCILLYASLVFIAGSPEPVVSACSNLAILTCMVIAALLRERADELKERQTFSSASGQMNSFQDVVGQDPEHPLEQMALSEGDSMNISARSADVFDPIYLKGANVTEQLETIKEMGRAEHWLVDETAVKLVPNSVLGSGGFGQVFKGVFCNMMVAVKVPYNKLVESSWKRLPALCNELRVLRYLRHPNIVAFHGAIVEPAQLQISLVLELVHGKVLHQFLLEPGLEGEPSAIARYQTMLGVCRALSFMHTRQPHLVHGDIKSTNILVEVSGGSANPKLLDFGLSRVITRETRRLGGTLVWMAPEVYQAQGPVKCSADTYSFGRLLFFIATSVLPLKQMSMRKLKQALKSRSLPLPKWPDGCVFEPTCKDLVGVSLRSNPAERPCVSELLQTLLRLPQELGWDHEDNHFLQEVHILAATAQQPGHACGGHHHHELAAEAPPPPPEGRLQQELAPKSRLPPLSEDAPFCEGTAATGAEPPPAASGSLRSGSLRSASSSGALRRPKGEAWPLPQQPETSTNAVQETLIQAVQRWNLCKPLDACCGWHANVRAGNKAFLGLLRLSCQGGVPSRARVQCSSCGVLDVPPGQPCEICGMELDEDESCADAELAAAP